MKIFLGGETSFKANDPFFKVSKQIRQKLEKFEKADPLDDTYGTEFQNIGIITTILGEGLEGMWKERKQIWRKKKEADIRLEINYEKFINANEETQILLYIKNIIDSIMVVENRKKRDFQGLKLIDDILKTLEINKEQLQNL